LVLSGGGVMESALAGRREEKPSLASAGLSIGQPGASKSGIIRESRPSMTAPESEWVAELRRLLDHG